MGGEPRPALTTDSWRALVPGLYGEAAWRIAFRPVEGIHFGSGAGGGTLGNELAQKGIRTVILEAGPRIEREEHIDDERESFARSTWLDKRTTSGSWQIAKDRKLKEKARLHISSFNT